MKLQAQYNKITIISTFFILLIAAAGYYFLIKYVLTRQLDEVLKVEEVEIYDYIKKYDSLPAPSSYKDQRISFEPASKKITRVFQSVEILDSTGNKNETSRQLLFPLELHGKYYTASVIVSEEATENLVWIILFSTIGLMVLLIAILFFTNRFLLQKLWRPFRHTLSSIKEFNLSAPGEIAMQSTRITEFKELNESIRMMAQKVMKDYQSLKNITDNASHEIQTPLAIINSKLDILIQEPELSEKSMEQIQGIYSAVKKLARLSQALLLLTRIENNQYATTQRLSINSILEEKIAEMQELTRSANQTVDVQSGPLDVIMNKELAEILVSNLFGNATRHSEQGDVISIKTGNHILSICNRGKSPLDKSKIFDRFYKTDGSRGTGLGLAIVKQICEQYKFKPRYEFSGQQHCFIIDFYAKQE